jgi:hypothetical protein
MWPTHSARAEPSLPLILFGYAEGAANTISIRFSRTFLVLQLSDGEFHLDLDNHVDGLALQLGRGETPLPYGSDGLEIHAEGNTVSVWPEAAARHKGSLHRAH